METTFPFWSLQNRREHRTPCTRMGRRHRTKTVSIEGVADVTIPVLMLNQPYPQVIASG